MHIFRFLTVCGRQPPRWAPVMAPSVFTPLGNPFFLTRTIVFWLTGMKSCFPLSDDHGFCLTHQAFCLVIDPLMENKAEAGHSNSFPTDRI